MISFRRLSIQRLLLLCVIKRDSSERLGVVVACPSVVEDPSSSFFQGILFFVIKLKLLNGFSMDMFNLDLKALLVGQGRSLRAVHEFIHFLVHHLALLKGAWERPLVRSPQAVQPSLFVGLLLSELILPRMQSGEKLLLLLWALGVQSAKSSLCSARTAHLISLSIKR
jgi:hypothetical protein